MSARSSARELPQDNGLPKTLTPNPKIANPLIPRLVDICTDTIVNNCVSGILYIEYPVSYRLFRICR